MAWTTSRSAAWTLISAALWLASAARPARADVDAAVLPSMHLAFTPGRGVTVGAGIGIYPHLFSDDLPVYVGATAGFGVTWMPDTSPLVRLAIQPEAFLVIPYCYPAFLSVGFGPLLAIDRQGTSRGWALKAHAPIGTFTSQYGAPPPSEPGFMIGPYYGRAWLPGSALLHDIGAETVFYYDLEGPPKTGSCGGN